MNYTTNYNLKKPEYDEFAEISIMNDNADIIDEALKNASITTQIIDNLSSTSKTAGLSANQGRVLDDKIKNISVEVVDNLTSTDTTKPLSANMGRALDDKITNMSISFVYKCTGIADSTAIANIVNDFFNNGTANTMKLIVTGTMGLSFTRQDYSYDRAMIIDADNQRGAVCYIDFSDCHIPEFFHQTDGIGIQFLYMNSDTIHLHVNGLNVKGYGDIIHIRKASNCSFDNCMVFSTREYRGYNEYHTLYISFLGNSTNNTFSNCTIQGLGQAVNTEAASYTKFFNCTIIAGETGGVALKINGSNNTVIACKIIGGDKEDKEGTPISNNGVNVYGNNNYFLNCEITGGSNNESAVRENSGVRSSGNNVFDSCKITGKFCGAYVELKSNLINCSISGNTAIVLDNGGSLTSCKLIGSETGISNGINNASAIKLIDCMVKGGEFDIKSSIYQTNTKWYITGCSFSKPDININQGSTVTFLVNENIYIPQYANQFNVDIN